MTLCRSCRDPASPCSPDPTHPSLTVLLPVSPPPRGSSLPRPQRGRSTATPVPSAAHPGGDAVWGSGAAGTPVSRPPSAGTRPQQRAVCSSCFSDPGEQPDQEAEGTLGTETGRQTHPCEGPDGVGDSSFHSSFQGHVTNSEAKTLFDVAQQSASCQIPLDASTSHPGGALGQRTSPSPPTPAGSLWLFIRHVAGCA